MQDISRKIESLASECISEIKDNARRADKVVTGRSVNSLDYSVTSFGDAYNVKILGYSYLWALEKGRGPARQAGTRYQQKEFLNNLIEWCKARGVPRENMNEEQLQTFARFLKWRINKYGTELYRKGGRDDVITPAERNLIDKIQSLFQKDIEINIQRLW